MTKLLLHIGMPKCGSSALQSYLSGNDLGKTKLGWATYAVLLESGQLVLGDEVKRQADSSDHGYLSSHNAQAIGSMSRLSRRKAVTSLADLGLRKDLVVLSNESWGQFPELFEDDCVFADPRFEISLVVFLRPQLEWMNSAWWQWGAWADVPIKRWINKHRSKANWYQLIQAWRAKPWVKNIQVKILDSDIVEQFRSLMGQTPATGIGVNQGLPEFVLRLFQRHRELRRGPHDSAVEFVLSRNMQFERVRSPWILHTRVVEELIEYYLNDNRALLSLLSKDDALRMGSDERWWSAESFIEYERRSVGAKNLSRVDLEDFAVEAIKTIFRMDKEIRNLKQQSKNGSVR